jgi:hypothetical protein
MIDGIEDAIGQLESVKHALQTFRSPINQDGLQAEIESAYQCLNFAWNIRHLTQEEYWALCEDESRFREMRSFPTDLNHEARGMRTRT